jgi:hypothetical protein
MGGERRAEGVRVGGILRVWWVPQRRINGGQARPLNDAVLAVLVRQLGELVFPWASVVSTFRVLICQFRETCAPLRIAEKQILSVDARCAE